MEREASLGRRMTRDWWHILMLWLVLCLPVLSVIWLFNPPTYEAVSMLQVEPAKPQLYGELKSDFGDLKEIHPYLQTQVQLITSGRVLKEALANSAVANLPTIAESQDPEADLKKRIHVEIIEDAFLIRVALELPNAEDAATIVNTVVESYLSFNRQHKQTENSELIKNLEEQLKILHAKLEEHKKSLKELVDKGTVEFSPPRLAQSTDEETPPMFDSYIEKHVNRIIDQMVKTDLELIEAKSVLEATLAATRAEEKGHAQPGDKKRDGGLEAAAAKLAEALNDAKIRVDVLTRTKEKLAKLYEHLKFEKKPVNSDTFQATFLNYDVNNLLSKRQQIMTNLQQVEFETKRDFYRVNLVDRATVPKIPVNNKRIAYIAAAPIGVLFAVILFFLLLEIRSGRRAARLDAAPHEAPGGE
jgi:uncharacterized protein involved in exopolysaccharide biosynthesis